MSKTILILDLDGVLITTPTWKADTLHEDGYSDFNPDCVANLNSLLARADFDIWLSSSRRRSRDAAQWSAIFERRGITRPVAGLLPDYPDCATRAEEIDRFMMQHSGASFLVIDDDKSLTGAPMTDTFGVVLTTLMSGFDAPRLEEALRVIV